MEHNKHLFNWYISNPLASAKDTLSLRVIREEFDRLYTEGVGGYGEPLFPNTPVVYALIRKEQEDSILNMRAKGRVTLGFDGDQRTDDQFPQILAIAEDRQFRLFDCSGNEVRSLSLSLALENRGTVNKGPVDTVVNVYRVVAETLCDCSDGIPALTPIVLSYSAPYKPDGRGFLSDVTCFHQLFNRASSL